MPALGLVPSVQHTDEKVGVVKYSYSTDPYNDRRYGKPWLAIVTTDVAKDFRFLRWEGRPGGAGCFDFEVPPGTMLAYGQRDNRKSSGGISGYLVCLPDGSTIGIGDCSAVAYRKLLLEDRWKHRARVLIDEGIKENSPRSLRDAQEAAAMLGLPDPVTRIARTEGAKQPEGLAERF